VIPRPAVNIGRTGGAVTTWNPSDKASSVILSDGNRTATGDGTSTQGFVRSTTFKSSGKWHFEGTFIDQGPSALPALGVMNGSATLTGTSIASSDRAGVTSSNSSGSPSRLWHQGTGPITGVDPINNGTVVAVEVDLDADEFWYCVAGGAWQGPFTIASLTGAMFITANFNLTRSLRLNCGQEAFAVSLRSGYQAWG
jgi:hypothetical protein